MMVGILSQAARVYSKIKPSGRNAGLIMQDNCRRIKRISHYKGDYMHENKRVDWTIEVDADLYSEVSLVCRMWGTTVETMTEAFIRFCVVPENYPVVKAFLQETKDRQKINQKVFQGVLELVRTEERCNNDDLCNW